MFLAVFAFMLLQNLAFCANLEWGDIEAYNQYKLTQAITFPGIIDLKADQKYETLDIVTMDSSLIYFQMHQVDCKNPDLVADMILINPTPEDRSRDHSVGIQLEEGCNLGIWIEASDYFYSSLFSAL